VISTLSVSVIPHLVHPRKAVDLPERITPQRIGHLGGIGQVSNPRNFIGTEVQPPCGLLSVAKLNLKRHKSENYLTKSLDSKVGCNEWLYGSKS
jgi:hypothetical protein